MASTGALPRIASIDIIRGAVMVLMAIDHVRVFAGVPAGGPSVGVFFTRWITHFCAPAFIFLAGTSAFLYGRKHQGLSKFLLTRGIWLVILELTVIRLSWTFNFDFRQYELAGVIWVIGCCMILMAALVKLPVRVVGAIGVIIIVGHNLLSGYAFGLAENLGNDLRGILWKIGYVAFFAPPVQFGPDGPNLVVLYSIVPWIGVMAAGYAFGTIFTWEPARRDRFCLTIGVGAILAFVVLRGFNLYGDPSPWSAPTPQPDGRPQLPAALSFLNTSKYPASLLFLLMTLGPTIAFIPMLERVEGNAGAVDDGVRQGAVLLLRPSHPAHSLHRPHRVEGPDGDRGALDFRQSPDGESATASGIHVEPGLALPRLAGRCRYALLRLPMVR